MAQLSIDRGLAPRIITPSPTHRPLSPGIFVNARLFRLLIGIGLVLTAAWYIYLYAFNKVSIAGVVNAPLVTIVSQLDGYIAEDNVGPRTVLEAGQPLVAVVDDRVDNRTLTELGGSREAARERLTALRASIAELTAIREDLVRRSSEYLGAWAEHLEHDVTAEAAALVAAKVVERQTAGALGRGAALVATGAISRASYDDLSYAHQRAVAEVSRSGAGLARRKADLAAAGSGILLSDANWSDVPYSRQRLDEIDIRLATLRNDEGAQLAAISELDAKYVAEKARIGRLSREELKSPVVGVVWRSWVAPGTPVVHGAPLMEVIDCNRIYIEATTRERFFESLRPGQPVRVRLEGADKDIAGAIRSVVGPGAPLTTKANVSAINRHNGTEAQLLVDLGPSLPPMPGTTCNVGRSAKVYFD